MTDAAPPPPEAAQAGSLRRLWKPVLLLVGLLGLGLTVKATLHDTKDVTFPSVLELVLAFAVTRTALACSARAWVRLIGPPAEPHLVREALYQSQLVKYLPAGGVVQAASQVAMTATQGVPVRRVTLAYAVLAVETVAAGLVLTSGLAFLPDTPTWLRVIAPLGLLAPLVLLRPVLAWALHQGRRLWARIPEPDHLPEQGDLWRAFGWCVGNQVLYSTGFTILLHAVSPDVPVVAATLGYILAWVVGFLVIPLPSGLGIREAVLVAVVPGAAAGPILAASLVQRLVAIAAEVTAAGGVRATRFARERRAQVPD